jgi:uncharacterized membrane protein (GlpM family)
LISDLSLVRLAASFAAGFVIVAAVTTLADRFGEGPAGFIGGLPSTGPVGILSIGVTVSTQAAIEATTIFPLGVMLTLAFLLFYAYPPRMGFWGRMAFALGLWFLAAVAVAAWSPDDFAVSLGVGGVVSTAVFVARSRIATQKTRRLAASTGLGKTILRGVLGGSVVVVVVVLSETAGPLVGGVFAAAPAIWSSSLYVTNRAQGLEFSRSLTWAFMKTGILTTIPFAIAARYFFSVSGLWAGIVLAYLAISPLAYLAWRLADRGEG